MEHETEIRSRLATIYVLISDFEVSPQRMKVAEEKLKEIIGILSGTSPLPAPVVQSEERG